MTFTDDDLERLKASISIYEDPIDCGFSDIMLKALFFRLEAAEKVCQKLAALVVLCEIGRASCRERV